jgi:hypothetical protein
VAIIIPKATLTVKKEDEEAKIQWHYLSPVEVAGKRLPK